MPIRMGRRHEYIPWVLQPQAGRAAAISAKKSFWEAESWDKSRARGTVFAEPARTSTPHAGGDAGDVEQGRRRVVPGALILVVRTHRRVIGTAPAADGTDKHYLWEEHQ